MRETPQTSMENLTASRHGGSIQSLFAFALLYTRQTHTTAYIKLVEEHQD